MSGIDPNAVQWDTPDASAVQWDAPDPGLTMDRLKQGAKALFVPDLSYVPHLAQGAMGVVRGGAQLLSRGVEAAAPAGSQLEQWAQNERQSVDARNAAANADYKARFNPDGSLGASLAQGAGASLVGGPLLGKVLPQLSAAAPLYQKILQGAGMGAGMGALTPTDQPGDFLPQKAAQVGSGAVLGGALTGGIDTFGRVIAPRVSDAVRKLIDAGISPTPGQIGGGWMKALEEKATSIPLLGDAIKAGQSRALDQFQRAVYVKALAPLGPEAVKVAEAAPIGNDGVRIVGDTLSSAYDASLARSVPNVVTPEFRSALTQINSMVPQQLRGEFADKINLNVLGKVTPGDTITPSVAKQAESELGRLASSYKGSSTASERELGAALSQAQQELRNLVAQNNPTEAPVIQAINKGWANLVQLENAAARVGAKDGKISPAQFLSAVKKSDPRIRDRGFARGEALNQDFAQAADQVLSQKYPDSGTAGRAIFGALAGGGLGYINPAIPITGAVGSLAYTPLGQRWMAGLLTKRPEFMQQAGQAITNMAPYAGAGLVPGLLGGGP